MRSIETKRTTVLFIAALMIAALAAGPAAPASAQTCAIPDHGEYTLPGDCTLAGTIDVNGSLTIHGNGHTIDANNHRAFRGIGAGESLTLDNVTVTNGHDTFDGGAIRSSGGTVTVSNSTFSGNSAGQWGGAIYSEGTVTVSNSTFSGNSAAVGGGAIENYYGTVTVSNSTFSGNSANRFGGAIDNWGGILTVGECSVFQGNTAGTSGDGIGNGGTADITGSVIYDEVYHGPSAASTVAEGNWWGSADGPGALANGFTVSSWWTENQCGTEGALPKCKAVVPFGTADAAPVSGEVRFFTDFGYDLPLRPEGWQMGAVEATAGEQTWGSVTVFCGNHVRAWLFDAEGNPVGLIPSQYENGDGVFAPNVEDHGVGGPEYGYVDAPPMYTGRYADMFAGE